MQTTTKQEIVLRTKREHEDALESLRTTVERLYWRVLWEQDLNPEVDLEKVAEAALEEMEIPSDWAEVLKPQLIRAAELVRGGRRPLDEIASFRIPNRWIKVRRERGRDWVVLRIPKKDEMWIPIVGEPEAPGYVSLSRVWVARRGGRWNLEVSR